MIENILNILTVVFLMLYAIQNGAFIWGVRRAMGIVTGEQTRPSVSIVVSLKNEQKNVEPLLKSLLSLHYSGELEILLVDDHSEDKTWKELQKFSSSSIQELKNAGYGKKQAIETAIKQAQNEWIAVTDADCEVHPKWLESMTQQIDLNTRMVLGPVVIKNPEGFLQNFQAIEFLGLQGATCGSTQLGFPISANAANMLVHKDTFMKLHPYADNYHLRTGDDQFLMMKISAEFPGSIRYCANREGVIRTYPVADWSSYFKQRIRWASKGSAYHQFAPVYVGLVVFMSSIVFGLIPIWAIFGEVPQLVWTLWLVKIISDYLLMHQIREKIGGVLPIMDYALSAILYPFVVVFTVIAGLFRK